MEKSTAVCFRSVLKTTLVLFVFCLLLGVVQSKAYAQHLPGLSSLNVSQVTVSPISVGFFYGVGSIRAEHNLAAGPAHTTLWSVGPDFNAFFHRRETELNDLYVSLESGLQRFGTEILNARVETNFGRVSKFKQYTDAGAIRRQSNLLIFLEENQEGVIKRDNRNRIWDVEVSARLPLSSLGDFLVGYKYHSVKSDITPYNSGTYLVPLPPPTPSILFPGLSGWGPYVLDGDNPAIPNSGQFKMLETFRWHGFFVGLRYNNFLPVLAQNRSYFEVIWSPCIFGRYELSWDTGFAGVYGSGKASQVTKANRRLNSFVEVRSGARFPVAGSLSCDFFLKYSYVRMSLSDVEYQSVDLEWPDFSAYNAIYGQEANQSITMRQNLFCVGASLVAAF